MQVRYLFIFFNPLGIRLRSETYIFLKVALLYVTYFVEGFGVAGKMVDGNFLQLYYFKCITN